MRAATSHARQHHTHTKYGLAKLIYSGSPAASPRAYRRCARASPVPWPAKPIRATTFSYSPNPAAMLRIEMVGDARRRMVSVWSVDPGWSDDSAMKSWSSDCGPASTTASSTLAVANPCVLTPAFSE